MDAALAPCRKPSTTIRCIRVSQKRRCIAVSVGGYNAGVYRPAYTDMSDTSTVVVAVATVVIGTYLKDFVAEDFRRFRDSQALAGALAGELQSHQTALPHLRRALEDMLPTAAEDIPLPLYEIEKPTSPIYEANLGRLGLLGSEIARQVAAVYEQIAGFRAGFVLLCKHHETMPKGQRVARIGGCLAGLQRAETVGEGLIDALNTLANARYRDRFMPR
jgi:hypothetical protein